MDTKNKNRKIVVWILLGVIVIAAFFVRFHNIEIVPAGIYPDEAVNGTDAILANEAGSYKTFYTNNYGREGLFINLIAFSIKIFGNTILGLKFWSIIFGTLTVLGVYLLTKELFRSERSGLIAAFLAAFSFWAINFSRISFRAIMVPFLLTFLFYFIFRGLKTKNYLNFILAGVSFGAGFHTYLAFRITPLILIVLFVLFLLYKKSFIKNYWKQILVFVVSALIVVSPLLYDFYKYPEHFESRTGSISIFSPDVNQGQFVKTLGRSVRLSLTKYNFKGDQNWRHNFPPFPILNTLVGISFLIGLIYVTVKAIHLLIIRFRDKIRDRKLVVYVFLLSWFVAMLAPEFLTAEGLPHALRSIGTLPVVFILATIPFLWILGKIGSSLNFFKVAVASLLIIAFVSTGITETLKYHYVWANNPEQHGAFNASYKNMALYLNSLPDSINKYVAANGPGREMEDGLPVSAHVIKYFTRGKAEVTFLKDGSDVLTRTPMVIILMNYEQELIERIKLFYPQASVQNIDVNPGHNSEFTAIFIN